MPDAPPPAPCRIYGRWTGQTEIVPPSAITPILIHLYDIPVPPSKPLHTGLRIQLIALSLVVYHTPNLPIGEPKYDTYDPHVEGPIVALKSVGKSVVEYVIENEREGPVKYAYVAVQYVPGVTAKMGLWETTCHWMFAHAMRDPRPVPYEEGARIIDRLPESPTPLPIFEYRDPTFYWDTLMMGVRSGEEKRGCWNEKRPHRGQFNLIDMDADRGTEC